MSYKLTYECDRCKINQPAAMKQIAFNPSDMRKPDAKDLCNSCYIAMIDCFKNGPNNG